MSEAIVWRLRGAKSSGTTPAFFFCATVRRRRRGVCFRSFFLLLGASFSNRTRETDRERERKKWKLTRRAVRAPVGFFFCRTARFLRRPFISAGCWNSTCSAINQSGRWHRSDNGERIGRLGDRSAGPLALGETTQPSTVVDLVG